MTLASHPPKQPLLAVAAGLALSLPLTAPAAQTPRRDLVVGLGEATVQATMFTPATWWDDTGVVIATESRTLLMIAATGEVRHRWGRRGRGPGEFEQIVGLSVAGDTLIVFDAGTRRLTHRFPTGATESHAVRPPSGVIPPAEPLGLSGRLIVYGVGHAENAARTSELTRIVRATANGEVVDSVGTMAVSGISTRLTFPGGSLSFAQPFARYDHVAIDPLGGWVAIARPPMTRFNRTQSVRIDALGPQGLVTYAINLREERLTNAAVNEWLETNAAQFAKYFGSVADARRALADALLRPDAHPPFRRTRVGRDGSVWTLESVLNASRDRWSVHDARGARLSVLELPSGSVPLVVSASLAWVLEENEDGEQQLVRYRLTEND